MAIANSDQKTRTRIYGKVKLTFENDWGVGPDQHSAGSGTTSRPSRTLGVDGDIAGKDDGVPPIPGSRLDPVDGIEDGSGGTIAGILAVDTFDVIIAGLCEKVHKGGLDRFGLVDDGLSANL